MIDADQYPLIPIRGKKPHWHDEWPARDWEAGAIPFLEWPRLTEEQAAHWPHDVGMVMGDAVGEGIVVLDFDTINERIPDACNKLIDEHPSWFDTLCVQTSSGGLHFLYWEGDPGRMCDLRNSLGLPIEYKGAGSYAKLHQPLEQYRMDEVQKMPDGLRDWIEQHRKPGAKSNGAAGTPLLPEAGSRNKWFSDQVYHRLKKGWSEDDALKWAIGQWQFLDEADKRGFTLDELRQIVYTKYRAGIEPDDIREESAGERLGRDIQDILQLDIDPLVQLAGPFVEGGIYIIAGPPGVAKTLWMAFFANALAGLDTFCEWTIPKRRKVLIIDGEMNYRLLVPRWQLLPPHRGVSVITEDEFVSSGTMPVVSEKKWQAHFLSELYEDIDVFVFDTTSSLFDTPGDMKATEAEYWAQVTDFNRKLRQRGKTAFYMDHTTGYDKERIAGSYDKLKGIDASLIFTDERESADDAPLFHSKATKTRIYFEGSPGFTARWWFSPEFGKFYRGPIPPPDKAKRKK